MQRLSPALKINIREAIYRLSGIYGKEFTLNGGIPSDLLYKCSASTVYIKIGKNNIFFGLTTQENILEETHAFLLSSFSWLRPHSLPHQLAKQSKSATKKEERLSEM